MISRFVVVLILLVALVIAQQPVKEKTILFLPLDERFTTRDIFLNMGTLTPYNVITPPKQFIPRLKNPANIPAIHQWIEENIKNVDVMIISAEMFLYGGLIGSRTGNETQSEILSRLKKLVDYKQQHPNVKIYLSTVVMRIPSYNGDFEEPWYWAFYGRDIYLYSFYLDKYNMHKNPEDKAKAEEHAKKVPKAVLDEFLWRRSRNFAVTVEILKIQKAAQIFEQVFITLDDNAEYGLNIREGENLKKLVKEYNLDQFFNIYPGADEVLLNVLSRMSVDDQKRKPVFKVVYRNPKTAHFIPNYEGQPLNVSIASQIRGAGGEISDNKYDIILLVNNWDTHPQQEAPNLPQPPASYQPFDKYLGENKILALADVRFSNGGDLGFGEYIHKNKLNIRKYTYAGWNTNGNTLGTVIANSVLLHLFGKQEANERFQIFRFLEDLYYQVNVRTSMNNYIWNIAYRFDTSSDLSRDLNFYSRYVFKGLDSSLHTLKGYYPTLSQYCIEDSIYFPWNRTFEIGMIIGKC